MDPFKSYIFNESSSSSSSSKALLLLLLLLCETNVRREHKKGSFKTFCCVVLFHIDILP